MNCSKCQHKNPDDAKFCNKCAHKLENACPERGNVNPPGSKFCNNCSYDRKESIARIHVGFAEPQSYTPKFLADKILNTWSFIVGDRKQVTVLFCDLSDSTAIAEQIGPEAMHALLNRFFELELGKVHYYEGTVNQFLGDGLIALCGTPLSHADHARCAVLPDLSLQRYLKEADPGDPYGLEWRFRIGLNTGLVS